ncbi:MAG: transposase [Mycoplasmatota bacterium]
MRSNTRYTAEQKYEYINLYYSSKMKVRDFIEKYDIKEPTFYSWLTMYRKQNQSEMFVPILPKLNDIIKNESNNEVSINKNDTIIPTNNTVTLEFNEMKLSFDINVLKQVLGVIS